MIRYFKYLIVLYFAVVLTCVYAENDNPTRFGISFNAGVANSDNNDTKNQLTYGFGVHTNFEHKGKFSGQVELSYDIKKEKYEDLKNYYYNENGELKSQFLTLTKGYGLLDLKYNIYYDFYQFKKINFQLFSGVGFNTLFWYGSKVESENFETITNGKTQIKITNPLTRPSIAVGPAIKFPYDKDKLMSLKLEYSYDYRFKNSTFTYPKFNTFKLKILLIL